MTDDSRTPATASLPVQRLVARELAALRGTVERANKLLAVLIFQIGFTAIAAAVYLATR